MSTEPAMTPDLLAALEELAAAFEAWDEANRLEFPSLMAEALNQRARAAKHIYNAYRASKEAAHGD